MAMIKTDPSQTKAVVVLLLILGGAVVVTVARIHPDGGSHKVSAPTATADVVQIDSEAVAVVNARHSSRNPFRRPDVVRGAVGDRAPARVPSASSGGSGPALVAEGGSRLPTSLSVEPAPVPPLPQIASERPASGQDGKTDLPEPDKSAFVLLATVGGPSGLCAVVRNGESNTRVVAVGDVLEGGYKVQKVEIGRIVLKNGRDTVVVKRPR